MICITMVMSKNEYFPNPAVIFQRNYYLQFKTSTFQIVVVQRMINIPFRNITTQCVLRTKVNVQTLYITQNTGG